MPSRSRWPRSDGLKGEGCRQFYFKYASTFDSTPAGNIGARDRGIDGWARV
jgi:uncharacterized protein YgbK (DUF1537 family)